MPYHESATEAARGAVKGAAGTAAAGAVTELTIGLDRAKEAAGDVLNDIFGGVVPWDLSPSGIVYAVTGGTGAENAADAAGALVPYAVELVEVLG